MIFQYVRISNANRADHPDAAMSQLQAFADQATEPDNVYTDAGVSGLIAPLARQEFSRMAVDIEQAVDQGHEVVVRVVTRDRLGRHRMMDEALSILFDLGVTIVTPEGPVTPPDQESNQEWLMTQVLQLFSEFERRELVAKLTRGKESAAAQGRHTGGSVPFGYRKGDDNQLVPNPDEMDRICAFRDDVADGMSIRQAYHNNNIPKSVAYRLATEEVSS